MGRYDVCRKAISSAGLPMISACASIRRLVVGVSPLGSLSTSPSFRAGLSGRCSAPALQAVVLQQGTGRRHGSSIIAVLVVASLLRHPCPPWFP